jgi:hypothetical protein
VKVERTFFKRPKAGNQRLVVPVASDQFVIDFNLFALHEVHKAQAAAGGNICLKKDCGCQSLALVRGFTEALAGSDDHRRALLEQRVMRALIEDNQTAKTGASPAKPKAAASEAGGADGESSGEEGGGGVDMLSMLMGAAVSDSDPDSGDEKPPTAARAAPGRAGNGGGRPALAAVSRDPSRPPAPRHDNVDVKGSLKAGAVARLGALAKKLAKHTEGWALAGLPPDCVCPITSEAMAEPVLCVGDGYTYEKGAATVWFLERSTSPVTGAELASKELVPNHAIKAIVDAFAAGDGVALPAGGPRGGGASGGPSATSRPRPAAPAPRARPAAKDLDSIYMSRKPSGAAAEIRSGAPAVRRPLVVQKDDSESEEEMSEDMFQVRAHTYRLPLTPSPFVLPHPAQHFTSCV